MLREIFGRDREEVTRGLRKLSNEELHELISSPDIVQIPKSSKNGRGMKHV